MERKRLAILISGRGSNMEAIVRATRTPDYPADVALVISDNPDAAGLAFAKDAGIAAHAFSRKAFLDKASHEAAIAECIDAHAIDLICLAGFMRVLSPSFTEHYSGRLINIHPSLLPKFKGLDTHERALAAGETEHGCSIHFVNSEIDGGEVIAQAKVPVLDGDTQETLAARVLVEEHMLYPTVIRQLCEKLNSAAFTD